MDNRTKGIRYFYCSECDEQLDENDFFLNKDKYEQVCPYCQSKLEDI